MYCNANTLSAHANIIAEFRRLNRNALPPLRAKRSGFRIFGDKQRTHWKVKCFYKNLKLSEVFLLSNNVITVRKNNKQKNAQSFYIKTVAI